MSDIIFSLNLVVTLADISIYRGAMIIFPAELTNYFFIFFI